MQEKYYMKKWELVCIALNLAVYKTITGYSRIFADISGPSATLTALFSGGITFLIIWGLLSLYHKHGNKNIFHIAEKALGKWAKYTLFIVIFLYLIASATVTLRETGEFIKAVSFPTAPLAFVFCIITAAAVLCCAQGFDAVGRAHSLIIPFALGITVIITLFSLTQGEISNLSPYLGYGIRNTFVRGLMTLGLYGDLIILFLLAPFSAEKLTFKKTALSAVGAGIAINVLIIFACSVTAPYPVSDTIVHPFHQLVKIFSIGRMLQRIDGYFMYIAAMCSILSLAVNIFFASYSATQAMSLPKIRPVNYPLGLIIILSALIFESRESAYLWAKNYLWVWFAVIFAAIAFVLILPKRRRA